MTLHHDPQAGYRLATDETPPFGDDDEDRSDPEEALDVVGSILIVEDEWLVSDQIEATLEHAGYHVVGVAVSAEQAIMLADMHRPDLVLMDIRLKGARDGFDAALEIRRRFDLPSLFISAHADPVARERGQASSPVGWLPKPFSGEQLLAAVRAVRV